MIHKLWFITMGLKIIRQIIQCFIPISHVAKKPEISKLNMHFLPFLSFFALILKSNIQKKVRRCIKLFLYILFEFNVFIS